MTTGPQPQSHQQLRTSIRYVTYFATSQLTCVLADGYAKRCVRTRLCCENIYRASSQHGPGTYQRASDKHFHCHTHTITSALKVAHPEHTKRTATSITGRALRAAHPWCLIYGRRVIFVKKQQRRARKGLKN
jgi:hypothetical protein